MMGERRDKRLEADLIYIEQCERRLSENREAFFGTLGDLFELATLIPVCEQYYGAEHFRGSPGGLRTALRLFGTARFFRSGIQTFGVSRGEAQAVFPLISEKNAPRAVPGAFLTEFMPRKISLFGSACGRTVQRQRPGAPSAGIRSM